jgi:hypothetical protein
MMSVSISSPDGVVENDRHHHHDHPVEMDAAVTPAPTPDSDPVGVIEAALIRLVDDVGVLAGQKWFAPSRSSRPRTCPATCACATPPRRPTAIAR